MKRDFLKGLDLSDDLIEKIMKEHGNSIQSEKAKVSSLESERDSLKTKLQESEKQIETIKTENGDNEKLQEQLKQLEAERLKVAEEAEKKLNATRLNYELSNALKESGALNDIAVKALLDTSIIKVSDDGILGLKEQLENVKTANPFLFKSEEDPKPQPKITPDEPANQTSGEFDPFDEILNKYK